MKYYGADIDYVYQIYISMMNLLSGAQLHYTWEEDTESLKNQTS